MDRVSGLDASLSVLQRRIGSAKSSEDKARLENDLDELMLARELIRDSMLEIAKKATDSPEQAERVQKPDTTGHTSKTYKEVVEYYKIKCFDWHEPKYESALKHMHILANLCEEKIPVERIKSAIDEVGVNLKDRKVDKHTED